VPAAEFLGADPDWCWCPHCGGAAPACWRNLDARMAFALMARDVMPCLHDRVLHHHEYPADWAAREAVAMRASLGILSA
jgi:hypothetical protein